VTYQTSMYLDGTGSPCSLRLRVDGNNDLGNAGATTFTGTEATTLSTAFAPATVVAVFTGLPAGEHSVGYKVMGNTCYVNRTGVVNAALVEETR
jgi:hypothetical protein